jgi:hypothetical protein
MKARFVIACGIWAILSATGGLGQSSRSSSNSIDDPFKQFLRSYLNDPRFGLDKTTRFSSAIVKVDNDTKSEAVVYISGQSWCGSGGCTLLVLEPHGSSYKAIGRTTIVKLPIRVLSRTTNGRPDLGVWVQGGGIQPGYEAILSFDGKAYPSNPSIPPAQRLSKKIAGKVLIPIADNAELLYE